MAEGRGGFENRCAGGDEVLNNETNLVRFKGALNGFGSAIVFNLFASHEHGYIVGDGDTGGNGEGGVWNTANDVIPSGGRESGNEGLGDLPEKCRVRYYETQVYVDRRRDA